MVCVLQSLPIYSLLKALIGDVVSLLTLAFVNSTSAGFNVDDWLA